MTDVVVGSAVPLGHPSREPLPGTIFSGADPAPKQEVVSAAGGMKERAGKDDWTLMQPLWECLAVVVKVLMFGARKYDRHNWVNVPAGEYEAAAIRHWAAYQGGEWLAQDSKLPHLAHMICDLLFAFWHRSREEHK